MTPPLQRTLTGALSLWTALFCAASARGQAPDNRLPERSTPHALIRSQDMADALRDVIAANRMVYARLIVQRLQQDQRVIATSDNWEKDKCLINPCEVLRLGAEAIQTKGAEFSYTLRSLTPLNPRNSPQTEVERLGLAAVARHPETNFYSRETLGGRRYLTAIYADKAVAPVCATCHNVHPKSARKDWREGDTMGGLIVRVPLEF